MRTIARISLCVLLVCSFVFLPLTSALATQLSPAPADVIRDPASLSLLMDEAGLLSNSEAAALRQKLVALSNKHNADIVIVTVSSIGSSKPMDFADDYFDYNGYGRGPNNDGILLLISMKDRDWWISTTGKGIYAFTDAGIEFIGEKMIANGLSSGDYSRAFNSYADWCDKFFTKAAKGKPFDVGRLPKTASDVVAWSIFFFVIGIIVARIHGSSLKKQLISVKKKAQASDYIMPGSLLITTAHDVFLNTRVTSAPIPVSTSSGSSGGGGGSSTHTSSSGTSHGGGGGKF